MCARRFATGLSGVAVRLPRVLRRSRRDEDETERVADVNAFRTSIAGGLRCLRAGRREGRAEGGQGSCHCFLRGSRKGPCADGGAGRGRCGALE